MVNPVATAVIISGNVPIAFIKTSPITVAIPVTIGASACITLENAHIAGDAINNAAPIAKIIGIAGAAAAPNAPNPTPAAAIPPPAAAPVVPNAVCDAAKPTLAVVCPTVAPIPSNVFAVKNN